MKSNDLLKQNYFQLFGIKPDFDLDLKKLKDTLGDLQKQYHPDKYLVSDEVNNENNVEFSQALAFSSHINEAYATLLDPLKRVLYLLHLQGMYVDLVHETKFSSDFIIEQIRLRENIASAKEKSDIAALEQIEQDLITCRQHLLTNLSTSFKQQQFSQVIELVKQLSFYLKLKQVVNDSIAQL